MNWCDVCGAAEGEGHGECSNLWGGDHAETETYSLDWNVRAIKAEEEIARLRAMGDAIVDTLPKCDIAGCSVVATKAVTRGASRWCDVHGPIDADYPRAAPVRAWQAERAKR